MTGAAVALGLLGAVSFATVFVAGGNAEGLDLPWVLLVARVIATLGLLPFAVELRAGIPRRAFRDVILMAGRTSPATCSSCSAPTGRSRSPR